MNPTEPNLPPNQPAPNTSGGSTGDKKPLFPKGDDMFIIRPPAKKPLDKKAIIIVSLLSFLGLVVLVTVLVFSLIGSASGLANDYRRLAFIQVKKLDTPLKDLQPLTVLNKRDINQPIKTITLSKQSQPSLENVLVVGDWSARYKETVTLQSEVNSHYSHIENYHKDLATLIAFDDNTTEILLNEPNLAATVKPGDPLSIRTLSGSYEGYAKAIDDMAAPHEMTDLKKQLVTVFRTKSTIYLNWARSLEAGDATAGTLAAQKLSQQTAKIAPLVADQHYATLMNPSYQKLTTQQKSLENRLAQ